LGIPLMPRCSRLEASDIEDDIKKQPNHIDEMPIPNSKGKPEMTVCAKLPSQQTTKSD